MSRARDLTEYCDSEGKDGVDGILEEACDASTLTALGRYIGNRVDCDGCIHHDECGMVCGDCFAEVATPVVEMMWHRGELLEYRGMLYPVASLPAAAAVVAGMMVLPSDHGYTRPLQIGSTTPDAATHDCAVHAVVQPLSSAPRCEYHRDAGEYPTRQNPTPGVWESLSPILGVVGIVLLLGIAGLVENSPIN